jgi:hypothetical protein
MYKYNHRHGKLNTKHLKRIQEVIDLALNEYQRVLAVRVDLHMPLYSALNDLPSEANFADTDEAVISRFMESLKAQIKSHLKKLERDGKRVRLTSLRFIWSREECPTTFKIHYHTLLLVNHDTFNFSGAYGCNDSLLVRFVRKAWRSALRFDYPVEDELIHIPDNPFYSLKAKEGNQSDTYCKLIYRTSYFAKYDTKLNDGKRNFGCSQG